MENDISVQCNVKLIDLYFIPVQMKQFKILC